ncbi:hypothetical protein KIF24_25620 [Micromonospora sp. Llam7]|uniref:hypothetical protein n=1 Tax=Micromonospora tarapacensis TaxID=2835305 RepID=UPI001C83153F|nr:hypothetical protein [Micromonospora tarapacensis]MBX7269071.1 hypothetical protein [Micromonospora tarapacensis]
MTVLAPASRRPGMEGVFWRFWLASTTAKTGLALTLVALPLVALTVLGASTVQVAMLAAAGQLAWLLLRLPASAPPSRPELQLAPRCSDPARQS